MTNFIPYGRQYITDSDIQAVTDVLKSDYLTQGPVVDKFENCISEYVGAKYAVAVSNATSALHLSCLALGVGKGDLVWTSPNTFVASANCALYCGADIDFVDINDKTYNLDVELLEEKLILAAKKNKLPKVVIPVHFSGQSCEMKEIYELSKQYGFRIIEDASHAVGADYLSKKVGCCQYSDIAIFSFHPVKIITTGEGGVAFTNNAKLARKISLLRAHGVTRDTDLLENKAQGAWYYEQNYLGFNYRITDIQCALGLSQLARIEKFLSARRQLVDLYNERLEDAPVVLPYQNASGQSSWHLYVIQLIGSDRKYVFEKMRQANIGVNVHYIPVHLQPYYKKRGFKEGDFPVCEAYYSRAITLPLHPQLNLEHIGYVVKTLTTIIHEEALVA